MSIVFDIGPALPDDAAAMGAILTDWSANASWQPPLHGLADDRTWCTHLIATQEVTVARDQDGTLLGFAACSHDMLTALYIAHRRRSEGVGRALLDAARQGRDRITVWTYAANAGAVRFYQREGFRVSGTSEGGEDGSGLPDLELLWQREGPP